jgi:hypothetical protein
VRLLESPNLTELPPLDRRFEDETGTGAAPAGSGPSVEGVASAYHDVARRFPAIDTLAAEERVRAGACFLDVGEQLLVCGEHDELYLDMAVSALGAAVMAAPSCARARKKLAEALVAARRDAEAIEVLRAARVLAPSDPEILGTLALALRRGGERDDALAVRGELRGVLGSNAEVLDVLERVPDASAYRHRM